MSWTTLIVVAVILAVVKPLFERESKRRRRAFLRAKLKEELAERMDRNNSVWSTAPHLNQGRIDEINSILKKFADDDDYAGEDLA